MRAPKPLVALLMLSVPLCVSVCYAGETQVLDETPVVGSIYAVEVARGEVVIRWVLDCPNDIDYLSVRRSYWEEGPFEGVSGEPMMTCTPGFFTDYTVADGETYWYQLWGAFWGSEDELPLTQPALVTVSGSLAMSLDGPSPNPVADYAMIHFAVPGGADDVALAVYDVRGRLVRRIVSGNVTSGRQSVHWNCCDESGERVAAGIYFLRFTADDSTLTRKLAVLR